MLIVKQRLVKQRLEFSTFLHFNLVKVYACNSVSSENYVPANTMCTFVIFKFSLLLFVVVVLPDEVIYIFSHTGLGTGSIPVYRMIGLSGFIDSFKAISLIQLVLQKAAKDLGDLQQLGDLGDLGNLGDSHDLQSV